jgi:MYXO-CTERM domain-containing protein
LALLLASVVAVSVTRGGILFPQVWDIYDNPGHSYTFSSGATVTVSIQALGTAQHHPTQGGSKSVGGELWTEIGARPTTSYDNNWNASDGKADYTDYIALVLSFDRPVSLTGDFVVTDIDWNQMTTVFAVNDSTFMEPDDTNYGASLAYYGDSARWINTPAGLDLPDNTADTIIGPNSGGGETDSAFRSTYSFDDAAMTDLVFVFAEAVSGGDGSGGALVWLDFSGESAAVVTATPEPHSAVLLLSALGVLVRRRRRDVLSLG